MLVKNTTVNYLVEYVLLTLPTYTFFDNFDETQYKALSSLLICLLSKANNEIDHKLEFLIMKKILLPCLYSSLLYSFCTFVSAAPIESQKLLSQSFKTCDNNARGIIEQASCLKDEAKRQDTQLNNTYKKLQSHLNTQQKAKLLTSQRLWLQSHQSDSELETVLYGNSQPDNLQLELNSIQRIAIRTTQLQRYLDLVQ